MRSIKIIKLYYILLLVTSFDLIFYENCPIPSLYSFLKMFDEIFVAIFFCCALLRGKSKESSLLLWVFAFFIVGAVGNLHYGTKLSTIMLGAYSTIKPILLYWSFVQYDFSWQDFHKFKKLICNLLPIIFISYVLDLIIPSFRSDIGIVAQAVDIRMGLRSLGGFFNRFTIATLYALLFYCFYSFYDEHRKNKYKILFADFMILSSFKVKDILGFLLARSFHIFKRFKIKYIVFSACVIYGAFILYANLMPEHYNKYFNFGEDSNIARVVLSNTSLKILVDRFPFGVGWGLFASPTSQNIQSPVYADYGIDTVYGLDYNGILFMSDTFWPMILGETGLLGLIIYLVILWKVFGKIILGFFKDTQDKRFVMPAFLFIAFLGFSIGKPVFTGPPHSLVLWGICGIFYSLKTKTYINVYNFK